ncbi:MAG: hypothetical protein GX567_11315 [Clostridia bacterium]|nr:hypothetical protein [Clostridia bacterium]
MTKEHSILDYLSQIILIWGISILSLCLFCAVFGETALEYSSIFILATSGIPISTCMQFLLMSFVIVSLRWLFFTDRLFKKLTILMRSILLFLFIIVFISIFAIIFKWFPVNELLPWLLFLICFFVYSSISVIISVYKDKSDNDKMQAALDQLKKEEAPH